MTGLDSRIEGGSRWRTKRERVEVAEKRRRSKGRRMGYQGICLAPGESIISHETRKANYGHKGDNTQRCSENIRTDRTNIHESIVKRSHSIVTRAN